MKPTNLQIKDAACLYVVHILQHPTSCPTTRWTHDTMVNARKKILSPLLAAKYSKSTKKSTRRCHQANTGNSGLEAERVRALGALSILWSKRSLRQGHNGKHTFHTPKEKRNGSRIMWIEGPQACVSNRSGYPASGPGLDRIHGWVRVQNRSKSWPAASCQAKPGPVPVKPRVLPGLAWPVGSNLRFCVSGFSIYLRI